MIRIRNDIFDKKDSGSFLVLLYIHIDLIKNYDRVCFMSMNDFLKVYNIRNTNNNVAEVKKSLKYMIDSKHISIQIVNGGFMNWEDEESLDSINKNTLLYVQIHEEDLSNFKRYSDEFIMHILISLSGKNKMHKVVEFFFFILSKMWFLDNVEPQPTSITYDNILKPLNLGSYTTVKSHIKTLEKLDLLNVEIKATKDNFTKNVYSIPEELKELQNNLSPY